MAPRKKSDKSKHHRFELRIDSETERILEEYAEALKTTKTDVINKGLKMVDREMNIVKDKYENSFKIDPSDIRTECPICHTKFDFDEDIDISPYRDGFRSVLMCPKCNFREVLSYTTEKDVEAQMEEDADSDL